MKEEFKREELKKSRIRVEYSVICPYCNEEEILDDIKQGDVISCEECGNKFIAEVY